MYICLVFVLGWKDFRVCHTNTIVIPSIQYAVELVLMQSFVLEQQYGNWGGKPVTAEVVAWKIGKMRFLLWNLWNTAPTKTGFVNKAPTTKMGYSGTYMYVLFSMSAHQCMQYANRSNCKYVDNCVFCYEPFCCFFAPFEAGFYPGITRTRDFCEFCTTVPVPRTAVSSVRHSYPYPNFLLSFYP